MTTIVVNLFYYMTTVKVIIIICDWLSTGQLLLIFLIYTAKHYFSSPIINE